MAPIKTIRAAQAVAEGCSGEGSTSTIRARSTAITWGFGEIGQGKKEKEGGPTCIDGEIDTVYRKHREPYR